MTPILSALAGLVKESRGIRRFVKVAVFNEQATAAAAAASTSGGSQDRLVNSDGGGRVLPEWLR